ncbi:MAG: hypothetical protein K5841_08995 [Fretibacterium sp.]|nr:hypothetical protein [Fretibacterium sp.]
MRILQVKFTRSQGAGKSESLGHGGAGSLSPASNVKYALIPAEWALDLEARPDGDVRPLTASPWLTDLLGAALYGSVWPGRWDVPGTAEILIEIPAKDANSNPRRFQIRRELCPEMKNLRSDTGKVILHGPASVLPLEGSEADLPAEDSGGTLDVLLGASPEAFLRGTVLSQRGFANLLRLPPEERGNALEKLVGPGLWGDVSALFCRRYLAEASGKEKSAGTDPEKAGADRTELTRTLDELSAMEVLLDSRAEEDRRQEALRRSEAELRDLDRRREDWERDKTLFSPLQQRLEKGRAVLELGDEYADLRILRQSQEKNRLDQLGVREDISVARDELHGAEEAVTLLEGKFRDKLAAQKRLAETAQMVRDLDRQIQDRQEESDSVRAKLTKTNEQHRDKSRQIDGDQIHLEKLGLALREAKKYLQTHGIDEKLSTGLPAIQRCFDLFIRAQERLTSLKEAYSAVLRARQKAQEALNDRQAMFSSVSYRFTAAEKERDRTKALLESVLKGQDLDAWRAICSRHRQRLEAMDNLARKFSEEQELQERLKLLRESLQKMQQESRSLNIRDVKQTGRIGELQSEVQKLEKRVTLLQRIDDLDALRELLQDSIPCPLCGAVTHPYVTGGPGFVPDPEEVHRQLREAQLDLDQLKDELRSRQTRSGLLSEEMSTAGRGEEDLLRELHNLDDQIAAASSELGLKFGVGVPPVDELNRVLQRERDQLQRASEVVDAAESASSALRTAEDELERLQESRDELARYHQEALFHLQSQRAEEERMEGESRSQEESLGSLRRELISQLSSYGYKSLPDENPESVIKALAERKTAWQEQEHRKDELERDLAVAQAAMSTMKRERDSLHLEQEDLSSRLRAVEAERDSFQQQRIVLFAARDPESEIERMNREVEELRTQLETRRQEKTDIASRIQELMDIMHNLETEAATGRDRLQKNEIAFGKKLLTFGFKNEDDYLSAALSDEERTSLQNRLKGLTQADLDLTAARENARALQLTIQARQEGGVSLGDRTVFLRRLLELNRRAGDLYLSLLGDAESERLYRDFAGRVFSHLRLRDLRLGTGDEGTRAQLLELVFSAILDKANERLTAGGESLRLSLGKKPMDLVSDSGDASDISLTALALAWGLSELFLPDGSPRLADLEDGAETQAWAHVRVLHHEGESVLIHER